MRRQPITVGPAHQMRQRRRQTTADNAKGMAQDAENQANSAKLAAEELYNVSVLVDQRFGHGTWAGILSERKKRIDEMKEIEKERIRAKKQQQEELIEMVSLGFIVLTILGASFGAIYILWLLL